MDLRPKGKRALATGSSDGIGAEIARCLAAEGCAVLVHGRNPARTERVAAELPSAGAEVDTILGELGSDESAAAVAERAVAWRTDILINNAGPFAEHDWETADPTAWMDTINLNVLSAVRMIRALVPGMRERSWGRIINLGTRGVVTPLPNMVEYSAAKAAVVNMTTTLARHLSGTGVTANTVSPGVTLSPGMQHMFEERARAEGRSTDAWPELAEAYAPNPCGRLGTGEDIATAVAFLASPLAGYINGVNLRVDGGISGVP